MNFKFMEDNRPLTVNGRKVKKDLTNLKVNRFTVIGVAQKTNGAHDTFWECLCDCGTKFIAVAGVIINHQRKSCGCSLKTAFKDIIGQTFNYLTVMRYVGKNSTNNRLWECMCKCGKTIVSEYSDITREKIKSCGCRKIERSIETHVLGPNVSAFNKLYNEYKFRAKTKEREFSLNKKEFKEITERNCYFCNIEPQKIYKNKYGIHVYNGIDRLDNDGGYTKDNAVPCCTMCNLSKRMWTEEIFKDWISRAHTHLKSTGQIP